MATIYQSKFMEPKNTSVDMSAIQDFTCVVSGSQITDYRLIIYNNDTSAVLYDTTKTALGTNLYNGDTLSVSVPASSVANDLDLKWTLEYWNGTESVVSFEVFFISDPIGTLTITVPATVTAQKYTFDGTYSESATIGIKKWYYEIFDDSDVLLETTDESSSGNITHTFEGFLSGESYKIKGTLENANGIIIESTTYTFDVTYSTPESDITPVVTFDCDKQALNVAYGDLVTTVGSVSGTSSYEGDFIYDGNKGLKLDKSAILSYEDIEVPAVYTAHAVAQFTEEDLILKTDFLASDKEEDIVGYETRDFVKGGMLVGDGTMYCDFTTPSTALTYYNVATEAEVVTATDGSGHFLIPNGTKSGYFIFESETWYLEGSDDISDDFCMSTLGTKMQLYLTHSGGRAQSDSVYSDADKRGYTLSKLINHVENYDFSDGTTGWVAGAGTSIAEVSQILQLTGLGTSSFTFTNNTAFIGGNDKYFLYIKARVTNSDAANMGAHLLGTTSGGNFNVLHKNLPVANQWYELYSTTTLTNAVGDTFIRVLAAYPDTATQNGKVMEVDGTAGVFAINLTDLDSKYPELNLLTKTASDINDMKDELLALQIYVDEALTEPYPNDYRIPILEGTDDQCVGWIGE